MRIATFLALSISSALFAHDASECNRFGVLGEWTMMRRSQLQGKSLANNSKKVRTSATESYTVLNSKEIESKFHYEPGYRVGAYAYVSPQTTFEFLALNCGEWHATKSVHAHQTLSFSFNNPNYTHDFNNASEAIGDYKSNFWSTELNYWGHITPRDVDYFSLSWIAGVRYMNITESFELTYKQPGYKSHYTISAHNHMPGPQLGLDLEITPQESLHWDILAKGGVLIDYCWQKTYLGDYNDTVTLRDHKSFDISFPFYIEAEVALGYQLNTHFNLHGGYDMLFITGTALAPEQIDRDVDADAGHHVYTGGNAIIHGFFLGLTLGF